MPGSHWFFVIFGCFTILIGSIYTKEEYEKEVSDPDVGKPKNFLEWIDILFLRNPLLWLGNSSYIAMKSLFYILGGLMILVSIISWYHPISIFDYLDRLPFVEVV